MDTRFHAVYLLTSDDPRCEGMYYIGYTVDPARRLQQHNGQMQNGAARTARRGQPWRMVCCVSGFCEDRAALRFEWMWQHAPKALDIREQTRKLLEGLKYKGTHAAFTGAALHRQHLLSHARTGLCYAVGVLHLLLRCDLFASMMLQLNIVDSSAFAAQQRRLPQSVCPPLVPNEPLFVIRSGLSMADLAALSGSTAAGSSPTKKKNAAAAAGSGGRENELLVGDEASKREAAIVNSGSMRHHNSNDGSTLLVASELSPEEERTVLAAEAALASQHLLPCGLCGLPLPPYRHARCSSTRRLCAPLPRGDNSSSPENNDSAAGVRSGDDDPQALLLGLTSGRCNFRAHTACAALLFYYTARSGKGGSALLGSDVAPSSAVRKAPNASPTAVSACCYVTPPPLFLPADAPPTMALIPTAPALCPMCATTLVSCEGVPSTTTMSTVVAVGTSSAMVGVPPAGALAAVPPPRRFVPPPHPQKEDEGVTAAAHAGGAKEGAVALGTALHWGVLAHAAKHSIAASRAIEKERRRRALDEQLAAQRQRLAAAGLLGGPPPPKRSGASRKPRGGGGGGGGGDSAVVTTVHPQNEGAATAATTNSGGSKRQREAEEGAFDPYMYVGGPSSRSTLQPRPSRAVGASAVAGGMQRRRAAAGLSSADVLAMAQKEAAASARAWRDGDGAGGLGAMYDDDY